MAGYGTGLFGHGFTGRYLTPLLCMQRDWRAEAGYDLNLSIDYDVKM